MVVWKLYNKKLEFPISGTDKLNFVKQLKMPSVLSKANGGLELEDGSLEDRRLADQMKF